MLVVIPRSEEASWRDELNHSKTFRKKDDLGVARGSNPITSIPMQSSSRLFKDLQSGKVVHQHSSRLIGWDASLRGKEIQRSSPFQVLALKDGSERMEQSSSWLKMTWQRSTIFWPNLRSWGLELEGQWQITQSSENVTAVTYGTALSVIVLASTDDTESR